MDQSSGVGPTSPHSETPKTGGAAAGGDEAGLYTAMHTPVATLDQLKSMLISNLGEEKGTKLYDVFMKTTALMMLQQMQHSSERAKQAAKDMRMNL